MSQILIHHLNAQLATAWQERDEQAHWHQENAKWARGLEAEKGALEARLQATEADLAAVRQALADALATHASAQATALADAQSRLQAVASIPIAFPLEQEAEHARAQALEHARAQAQRTRRAEEAVFAKQAELAELDAELGALTRQIERRDIILLFLWAFFLLLVPAIAIPLSIALGKSMGEGCATPLWRCGPYNTELQVVLGVSIGAVVLLLGIAATVGAVRRGRPRRRAVDQLNEKVRAQKKELDDLRRHPDRDGGAY